MAYGWKLLDNGDITRISVNEWYLIGIYKTLIPTWLTDKPCKTDFEDWSRRIPRASDNYDGIRGVKFCHGLFYRQVTRTGDGQLFKNEWVHERPGGPEDRECDGVRQRNGRATGYVPEYTESRTLLGSYASGVISEFLESEKKRNKNYSQRHEAPVQD